jgi:transposase InsO family protein
MPWQEMRVMDQRVRFAGALVSDLYTMTELCAAYGISRKTGYKWAERYRREGIDGLKDRSRAPGSCPHRTEPRCEEALVAERQKRPRWGPRKLLKLLEPQHPDWGWPAESTAGEILKRHGLVESRRCRPRRLPRSKPTVETAEPNDLWTADYKGEFRMGNRRLCYPLTVADQHSRYLLACDGRTSVARDGTRATFERLFAEYGLPSRILTDNGLPFAGPRSPRRLSRLSVWWIQLGIEPIVTQPGHPEQNGCHERMHRTLKDATARPPASCMRTQQRAFDVFRAEYNEIRPHESLEMRPPATLYAPSARPYPKKTPQTEYPGHWEIRRVSRSGEFAWRGQMLYLTATLAGQNIGLHEIDDGIWSLSFGDLLLGRYDERTKKLSLL